ncbi:hypothetical protein VNO78_13720 [Psophocarpus tetragonolobus]|uniref:Uncharacterized protein n=1 Tax=Psophocarpus tetragonolobus TaxID=3891 RepID=A0AAN9SQN1_PSOTE
MRGVYLMVIISYPPLPNRRALSEFASVNCLLELDDDVVLSNTNSNGNVKHSKEVLETNSFFESSSFAANLPLVKIVTTFEILACHQAVVHGFFCISTAILSSTIDEDDASYARSWIFL